MRKKSTLTVIALIILIPFVIIKTLRTMEEEVHELE